MVGFLAADDLEMAGGRTCHGGTVIDDDAHTRTEGIDQYVPHDPRGRNRRVGQEPRLEFAVQNSFCRLQDNAPVAVHNALRLAGRARRKDNPQRVRELHPGELRFLRRGDDVGEDGARHSQVDRISSGKPITKVVDQHVGLNTGHLLQERSGGWAQINLLAVEPVAVRGQQNLRLKLNEPVQHSRRTELSTDNRPDRANGCAGQQADDSLGNVREHGTDNVAFTHPG